MMIRQRLSLTTKYEMMRLTEQIEIIKQYGL